MSSTAPVRGPIPAARPQSLRSIGDWRLVADLAVSGRSRVARARPAGCQSDWPADYVVKLLDEKHVADPLNVALIQREAFVGRLASHPHLTPVLASHVDHPPYYLVAPFLEGATLAAKLQQPQPLSTSVSLWIARQIAEALAELHRLGWLHSDVKPANIVVAGDGHSTLIDLGFARRCGTSNSDQQPLLGTLAYSAPENFCRARPLTGAADVYSLGATLYEMLVSKPPFTATDLAQLASQHLTTAADDVRRWSPQIPFQVAQLVSRALAKDPLRRPSADELVDRLIDLEIETFDDRTWAA